MTRIEKKQQRVMNSWNGRLEKESNIEYILRNSTNDTWAPSRHPHWNWVDIIYRVKPSPFNIWVSSLRNNVKSLIKLQVSDKRFPVE